MLSRALLSATLIGAVMSCGEAPTTQSQEALSAVPRPPVISDQHQSGESTAYADWTETRALTCEHMRGEIAAGRFNAEGPPSEPPYRPEYLPGFTAPSLTPADVAIVRRLFGRPCEGLERIWAAPMSAFDIPEDQVFVNFALIMRPMTLLLPDGRAVMLAPAMPGDSHATVGFHAAYVLGLDQQRLFVMTGGGTFGYPGRLSVPLRQPLGAFHVWLEGGGTWQGHTQGWAGITDFAGALPRARGSFLTYGDIPCDRYAQQDTGDALCRGATEYSLTSIDYSDNGADELILVWSLEAYDVAASGARVNRRTTTLTAHYELRDDVYHLTEGAEPPRV